MHINKYAVKLQVNMLITSVLTAIKNRSNNPQWKESVIQSADRLWHLSNRLESTKSNVQHFGRFQAEQSSKQGAYRTQQSTKDKTNTFSVLEQYMWSEWDRVIEALRYEAKKSPFES